MHQLAEFSVVRGAGEQEEAYGSYGWLREHSSSGISILVCCSGAIKALADVTFIKEEELNTGRAAKPTARQCRHGSPGDACHEGSSHPAGAGDNSAMTDEASSCHHCCLLVPTSVWLLALALACLP